MYEYGLVYGKPSHLGSSNRNLHPCDENSKEIILSNTRWALIESGFQAKLAFVELFGNFVHSIDPNLLFRAMQGVSLFIQNSACTWGMFSQVG